MKTPIASISRVTDILKKNNLHAKKFFGQNFIIDRNIIDKIVKISDINENSLVLEVGPGIGSLTEALCEKAKHVVAVEIDSHMVSILKDACGNFNNLEIIHSDFLDVDVNSLCQESLTVCANLPYYVTTPILFKLFESNCTFDKIVVMVQKEVAQRFNAKKDTKQYNSLSIFVQTCFNIKVEFDVSKHVFIPKPAVDSSVVSFVKKESINIDELRPVFEFIKKCFAYRRKTLHNNLKDVVGKDADISQLLEQANLPENIRSQSLDFQEFKRLYEVIYEN
jgi:16S rRNA (adenine1518-N6/adenine1519-N6)-dimethyltransferase